MTSVHYAFDQNELAADRTAVANINFCSLWPTAKPILQQLASVISSSLVKFAINTVISAGDSYCSSGGNRLERFGISPPPKTPPATVAFLSNLSDNELHTLSAIVQQAKGTPVADDIGNNFL